MSEWTATQIDVLNVLSFLPAALSITGSSLIIYHIVKGRKTGTKNRLLAISLSDIVLSTNTAYLAALVPSLGRAMCQTNGFFALLGSAVSFYSGCSSVYFLQTIRYDVPEQTMRVRLLVGCHIADFPFGCSTSPDYACIRGQDARIWFWIFSGAPHAVILIIIVVCQLLVVKTVRQRLNASKKYRFHPSESDNQSEDRVRAVALQSLFYVLAYAVALVPASITKWIDLFGAHSIQSSRYFGLYVVVLLLYPLQGFLNFLVFVRPRYFVIRKLETRRWHAFCHAAFVVGNPEGTSNTNSSARGSGYSHSATHRTASGKKEWNHGESSGEDVDVEEDTR